MFNKPKDASAPNGGRVDTLIGKNTYLEGMVNAEGTIRVDGKVNGEIIVAGNLISGEESTIKGNIRANSAYISGLVEGNITAETQLHLTDTAKVIGDICVKSIIIDEGAVFIGNCKSSMDKASPGKASPENDEVA